MAGFKMTGKATISINGGPPIQCTHVHNSSCIENAALAFKEFKPGELLAHKPECECLGDGTYEITYQFTYGAFEIVAGMPLPVVRFPADAANRLGDRAVRALLRPRPE